MKTEQDTDIAVEVKRNRMLDDLCAEHVMGWKRRAEQVPEMKQFTFWDGPCATFSPTVSDSDSRILEEALHRKAASLSTTIVISF